MENDKIYEDINNNNNNIEEEKVFLEEYQEELEQKLRNLEDELMTIYTGNEVDEINISEIKTKIILHEKEIDEYQDEINRLKSLDIVKHMQSNQPKENILNEILEKIEYEYTYNVYGNMYFANKEAQQALIRKLEIQFIKDSAYDIMKKNKLSHLNQYFNSTYSNQNNNNFNNFNNNNNLDNENELILNKHNFNSNGEQQNNNNQNNKNSNNNHKILIEFKDDFFEYYFEISSDSEANNKQNFQKLQNIACNYWHIPKEHFKHYFITYNNKILSKNESLINHFLYIKEKGLTNKYELKNRNFYIMDLNEKKESENKFQEKAKSEKVFNLSYFSEIELYECDAKIAELEKEFRTERGFLTEKIQKITYDNIRFKLKELNSAIIETGENFKDLDQEETKDFLSSYASRAESHNLKKNDKIKEITIKAYNRQDIPLILSMKDLWMLKAKQTLMLLFYIVLLILHLSHSRSEKNDNQISFNLYNYLRSVFTDNRLFKHLTLSEIKASTTEYDSGSKIFKDRDSIYFYINFFITNLLYFHLPQDQHRNTLSRKYNRLIIYDPARLAQKYPENTRNLTQFNFITKFNFKLSNYFQFEKPFSTEFKNDSQINLNCVSKRTKENYTYFDDELKYFSIADLFTRNISLCDGFPRELNKKYFESTFNLKFNISETDFKTNEKNSIKDFGDYVTNKMQNNSLLLYNNKNFYKNISQNQNADLFLAFSFNQENSLYDGQIMNAYTNQGYVMNYDYMSTSSTLYFDTSSTIMKNLIYTDNIRVINIKNIVYFKKFDLYVKGDFYFELGALGVIKPKIEFTLVDYYSKVKSSKMMQKLVMWFSKYCLMAYLFFSIFYRSFLYLKYKGYKITNVTLSIIIYDAICLSLFILHIVSLYNLESSFMESINNKVLELSKQENNTTKYLSTTELSYFYKFFLSLKIILNFFLMLRIFYFLKISPSITFYIKIIKNFIRTFFSIYFLIIISVFILTLICYYKLAGKSLILQKLLDTIFFSARLLLSTVDAEPFQLIKDYWSFICFALAFIIKVFVFSIIYAALKELYEYEIREFTSYREIYHIGELGDFVFFVFGFILKNFYNYKEYLNMLKDHEDIISSVKNTMPERKNFNEFSELTEYELIDLAENLEKNNAKLNLDKYQIVKFYLRQKRNVYLIMKKK